MGLMGWAETPGQDWERECYLEKRSLCKVFDGGIKFYAKTTLG